LLWGSKKFPMMKHQLCVLTARAWGIPSVSEGPGAPVRCEAVRGPRGGWRPQVKGNPDPEPQLPAVLVPVLAPHLGEHGEPGPSKAGGDVPPPCRWPLRALEVCSYVPGS